MWPDEQPLAAFGTWAHSRIAAAKAHLMFASVDGAARQISPVLGLSPEYRISTLAAHVVSLTALLRHKPVADSREAAALREQLRQFACTAPTQTEDP